jgi:hypothetical protein
VKAISSLIACLVALGLVGWSVLAGQDDPVDFEKARQLRQRMLKGERLNDEESTYLSAFAVRRLIRDQIEGKSGLNPDPGKGEVKAPLMLWGPYLWADGVKGRKADGLVWRREDLAGDGTHPSDDGQRKVAELLLNFFKTDPTAKGWFLKPTALGGKS